MCQRALHSTNSEIATDIPIAVSNGVDTGHLTSPVSLNREFMTQSLGVGVVRTFDN